MKYLQNFFKRHKSSAFTQEEIDEIEDILLTYLEGFSRRFKFYKIDTDEDIKPDNKLNYYYISTERPFHNVNKKLFEVRINIHSNCKISKILPEFQKRMISFGYNSIWINPKDLRSSGITHDIGLFSGDTYIISEYRIKISKIK